MAIVLRQVTHATGAGVTTLTKAYAQNVLPGSLLVCWACNNQTTDFTSITESLSDPINTAIAYTGDTSLNEYLRLLYVENTVGGACSWTLNNTNHTGAIQMIIAEYTGVSTQGSLDQASARQHGHSTGPATNPLTPGFVGELAVSLLQTTNAPTITWNNGFTQEDQTTGAANTLADQVLSSASAITASVTLGSIQFWGIAQALFTPQGVIKQLDANNNAITGNGPGTVTGANACKSGDVILVQFQLSNVTSGNSGFVPTISDNVNSGNYQIPWIKYYASGSKLIGVAYIICNNSGTPTVTLASSALYNNGQLSYVRFTGFSAEAAFDNLTVASGTSASPSGSLTTNGSNELVAGLTWGLGGGGSYSVGPTGWNFVTNASGGSIISPYWLENFTPASASFSGTTLTSSQDWFLVLISFSSGSVPSSTALPYSSGPGISPDKQLLFHKRNLSSTVPAVFYFVTGFGGGYGFGTLLPAAPRGAVGFGGGFGSALLTLQGFAGPAKNLKGPGISADWPQTFIERPGATSTVFVPAGVITAFGYGGAYGFASVPNIGQLEAFGYGGAYGFLLPNANGALLSTGYAGAYGFGNLAQYVAAVTGYSGAYGFGNLQVTSALFPMPQVIGLLEAAAQNILQALNLIVNVQQVYSTLTPAGYISQQFPNPGVLVQAGSVVTIYESLGQFVRPGNPQLGYKVTTRVFSLEEMVSREWGPSFRAPDHRIYVWSNNRSFDSTDIGITGIYNRGTGDKGS